MIQFSHLLVILAKSLHREHSLMKHHNKSWQNSFLCPWRISYLAYLFHVSELPKPVSWIWCKYIWFFQKEKEKKKKTQVDTGWSVVFKT